MVTKAHILQEIIRTAAANEGVALGWHKFESETGIKHADWHGKHWARWGDALRDAGYAPNKLQSAYQDTYLLKIYAQLARELGRLPASSDLRLKNHNTPNFPSNSTFEKFGTKSEFIKRVLEYCESQKGYEDVVRMCKEYVPRERIASDERPIQEEKFGFVYLIKSGRFFKIGKSNAAGRREYELAIQLPEKAMRIHVIRTDDPGGIEEYWHKRFEAKHKNGEWFDLDAADVAAFRRRKFM